MGSPEPDQFYFTYLLGPAQTAQLAPDGEGFAEVKALVTDLAGNETTLTVAKAVPVDTLAPATPDVVGDAVVVYTRIPWGSDTTDGAKRWLLRGGEGAAESDTRVRVYDGATIDGAMFLGQTAVNEDGAFGALPGEPGAFALVPADSGAVSTRMSMKMTRGTLTADSGNARVMCCV